MSWIAEYDTQGREFPTCVHVTKTTGTMTHGATYVPIEDGKAVRAENAKLREQIHWLKKGDILHVLTDQEYIDQCERERLMQVSIDALDKENAKLREQMERLVTLLRVDCDIEASWDGLRKFWSIGLTENGCLMRDRACKAEAENAKLRELLSVMAYCNQFRRDCDGCSMNGAAGIITERAGCDELLDRLRELGVEVDG